MLAVLLVVGGGWLVWHSSRSATFGWFAYAPLSESVYSPGILTTTDWVGLALVAVGLLALGAVGGYALGRRRGA
ncbi:hypothetical protein D1825_11305 [Cellulomonas rhizosphaerae]|uniref:Uncharacterized protein n=1 Tax=Cellulomonas rhizosphaerae TaxID=2293719 RepID=A0A413RKL6_9CELL|nr:hypothetical protein D1825_11305 [Cellulomonas rhizosphaerae]